MTELNVFIAAGADDGFCYGNAKWYDIETYVEFGYMAGFLFDTWLRFIDLTIPQGNIIDSAILRFVAHTNRTGTTLRSNITGEDVDDATRVVSCANMAGRDRTTALVAWDDIPIWAVSETYDSVDISAIIQEIVNRPGWVSGNAINIFIDDDGSDHNAGRCAESYEGAAYDPVQLRITHSAPPSGGYAVIF